MRQDEHELQKACVNWFGYQYPHLKDLLIAIPNGGKRHVKTAKKLKAEGVKSGVPDLFLAYPMLPYSGIWIEMKTPKGIIRDSQKKYLERFKKLGYWVSVCRSFEDFEGVIRNYVDNGYLINIAEDASKKSNSDH